MVVPGMWGLQARMGTEERKMWGVTVPPESPLMKMGGGKPTRYEINTPHTING